MPPFSRRQILQAGATVGLLPLATFAGAAAPRRKMLFVSTNVPKVGDSVSGTFLMEIALPFQYLTDAGIEVDVVTPKGGKAEIYHAGEEQERLNQIKSSAVYIAKTEHSLAPRDVAVEDYSGVYYPGGHAQFWDVVDDPAIASITAQIHERGGVVGTAGHGAASLVNVRLSNGNYLVAGKRMTAFPWWAEKKFMPVSNYGALLPFDMEKLLQERGAVLTVPDEANRRDESKTLIIDEPGRLVTGTWATLATSVAKEMQRMTA